MKEEENQDQQHQEEQLKMDKHCPQLQGWKRPCPRVRKRRRTQTHQTLPASAAKGGPVPSCPRAQTSNQRVRTSNLRPSNLRPSHLITLLKRRRPSVPPTWISRGLSRGILQEKRDKEMESPIPTSLAAPNSITEISSFRRWTNLTLRSLGEPMSRTTTGEDLLN